MVQVPNRRRTRFVNEQLHSFTTEFTTFCSGMSMTDSLSMSLTAYIDLIDLHSHVDRDDIVTTYILVSSNGMAQTTNNCLSNPINETYYTPRNPFHAPRSPTYYPSYNLTSFHPHHIAWHDDFTEIHLIPTTNSHSPCISKRYHGPSKRGYIDPKATIQASIIVNPILGQDSRPRLINVIL